jgi:hypothetical protein
MLADTLKKTTDWSKLLGRLYFHLVANEDYAYYLRIIYDQEH